MTNHLDVAERRDLVARWCALAEKRLQHLTELFESGRWRRYHSERDFLENIKEARDAVETWRALSRRPTERGVEVSRPFRSGRWVRPLPFASAPSIEASLAEEDQVAIEEAPTAPVIDLVALERALEAATPPPLDLAAISQRYPLLRNAL